MSKLNYLRLFTFFIISSCMVNLASAKTNLDDLSEILGKMLANEKESVQLLDRAIKEADNPNMSGEFKKTMKQIDDLYDKNMLWDSYLSGDYEFYLQQKLSDKDAVKFEKAKKIVQEFRKLHSGSVSKLESVKRSERKKNIIFLITSIYSDLEAYRVKNNKFPDWVSQADQGWVLNKTAEVDNYVGSDTKVAEFYKFSYKKIGSDGFQLEVKPLENEIKNKSVFNENYFLTQDAKILIKDSSDKIIDTVSIVR